MFLSPVGEKLGEEVNTKTVSCIAPSPIVAGFRIRAEGVMAVRVLWAILVLTLVIPTGCSRAPAPDDDQTPEGVTEKMSNDDADCRRQTRAMAGATASAWSDRAYSDCMAGRGYRPGAGQTK